MKNEELKSAGRVVNGFLHSSFFSGAMNWSDWYHHYAPLPSLQDRLRLVRELVVESLNDCPPGPIRIVSVCAGDGRDLAGAIVDHPRRSDITAWLLDSH